MGYSFEALCRSDILKTFMVLHKFSNQTENEMQKNEKQNCKEREYLWLNSSPYMILIIVALPWFPTTSWHGNTFCITGGLWWDLASHWTRNEGFWWFRWCQLEQVVWQTTEIPVISWGQNYAAKIPNTVVPFSFKNKLSLFSTNSFKQGTVQNQNKSTSF